MLFNQIIQSLFYFIFGHEIGSIGQDIIHFCIKIFFSLQEVSFLQDYFNFFFVELAQ